MVWQSNRLLFSGRPSVLVSQDFHRETIMRSRPDSFATSGGPAQVSLEPGAFLRLQFLGGQWSFKLQCVTFQLTGSLKHPGQIHPEDGTDIDFMNCESLPQYYRKGLNHYFNDHPSYGRTRPTSWVLEQSCRRFITAGAVTERRATHASQPHPLRVGPERAGGQRKHHLHARRGTTRQRRD